MLNAKQLGYRLPVVERDFSSAWWVAFALWHVLAISMPIRRACGEFVQPLSGWALLGVVLFVLGASSLLRISARWLGVTIYTGHSKLTQGGQERDANVPVRPVLGISPAGERLVAILPTIAGFLIVGSVSLAGSSLFFIILVWGVLIASETAWLARIFSTPQKTTLRIGTGSPSITSASDTFTTPASKGAMNAESTAVLNLDDGSLPSGVTQQLIRTQHDHGESLSGLLRVDFPVGERTQFVHLAFCPPFVNLPEIHVAQVSGPTVSVKMAQAETFGMRIEVKRNQTEFEPLSVVLEIEATAAADK